MAKLPFLLHHHQILTTFSHTVLTSKCSTKLTYCRSKVSRLSHRRLTGLSTRPQQVQMLQEVTAVRWQPARRSVLVQSMQLRLLCALPPDLRNLFQVEHQNVEDMDAEASESPALSGPQQVWCSPAKVDAQHRCSSVKHMCPGSTHDSWLYLCLLQDLLFVSMQAMYQRVHGAAEHQQVYVMPSGSGVSDQNSDVSSQVGRRLGFSAAQRRVCMPAIPSQSATQSSARGLNVCYSASHVPEGAQLHLLVLSHSLHLLV